MTYTDKELPVRVEGQVIDATGQPLAGVTVVLSSMRNYFPGLLLLVPHQMPRLESEITTQSDGRFSLDGKISSTSQTHTIFVIQREGQSFKNLARVPYTQGAPFQILRVNPKADPSSR